MASGAVATPIRPTKSVWPRSQSRNRGRWPARSWARARLFISAIFTSAGQAIVHIPQPEHQSTVASGDATCGTVPPWGGSSVASRNRWACGPTYFGPGNRSVTRATGQTVLQTLHLRQSSADRPTSNADASATRSWIVIATSIPRGRRAAAAARRSRFRRAGPRAPLRGIWPAYPPPGSRSRSRRRRRSAPRGSASRPGGCPRSRRCRARPCPRDRRA